MAVIYTENLQLKTYDTNNYNTTNVLDVLEDGINSTYSNSVKIDEWAGTVNTNVTNLQTEKVDVSDLNNVAFSGNPEDLAYTNASMEAENVKSALDELKTSKLEIYESEEVPGLPPAIDADLLDGRPASYFAKNENINLTTNAKTLDGAINELKSITNTLNASKVNRNEVTNVMTPKGKCNYAALPMAGNNLGDYYYCPDGNVTDGAGNYAWNGTIWYFAGTGDEGYSKLNDKIDELQTGVDKQAKLLGNILLSQVNSTQMSLTDVLSSVRQGLAPSIFNIGDQIIVPWIDVATNQEYSVPLDIVEFGYATLENGDEVPKMTAQWHYATPFGVQFSNYQAFYYAEEGLPAGTYNIEIGTTWGANCVAGTSYQFTLTQDVPVGGQLAGFRSASSQSPTNWKVYSYSSKTAVKPIETVAVTEGSQGTKLGTLKAGCEGVINCLQSVAYGYNRWGKSALRQWLNSDKDVGEWWEPQTNFDRVPDQLATKAGFLTGFDEEFRDVLRNTKVVTALNTVTDSINGANPLETTYDKIYIPSLEQMYINPQLAWEGDSWEYWKTASNRTTKMSPGGTYPQIRTFAIENPSSAQAVRLRSTSRDSSCHTWYVNSSGYVYGNGAIDYTRCAPACDLC